MRPAVFRAKPTATCRTWGDGSRNWWPDVLGSLPIEAVYSSPLKRALECAQLVAAPLGMEVRTDDRLMEINAGIFQGLDWSAIEARYPREAGYWRRKTPTFTFRKANRAAM